MVSRKKMWRAVLLAPLLMAMECKQVPRFFVDYMDFTTNYPDPLSSNCPEQLRLGAGHTAAAVNTTHIWIYPPKRQWVPADNPREPLEAYVFMPGWGDTLGLTARFGDPAATYPNPPFSYVMWHQATFGSTTYEAWNWYARADLPAGEHFSLTITAELPPIFYYYNDAGCFVSWSVYNHCGGRCRTPDGSV